MEVRKELEAAKTKANALQQESNEANQTSQEANADWELAAKDFTKATTKKNTAVAARNKAMQACYAADPAADEVDMSSAQPFVDAATSAANEFMAADGICQQANKDRIAAASLAEDAGNRYREAAALVAQLEKTLATSEAAAASIPPRPLSPVPPPTNPPKQTNFAPMTAEDLVAASAPAPPKPNPNKKGKTPAPPKSAAGAASGTAATVPNSSSRKRPLEPDSLQLPPMQTRAGAHKRLTEFFHVSQLPTEETLFRLLEAHQLQVHREPSSGTALASSSSSSSSSSADTTDLPPCIQRKCRGNSPNCSQKKTTWWCQLCSTVKGEYVHYCLECQTGHLSACLYYDLALQFRVVGVDILEGPDAFQLTDTMGGVEVTDVTQAEPSAET